MTDSTDTWSNLDIGQCPSGCDPKYLVYNPNRPREPWVRCWNCGRLWDGDGAILFAFPVSDEEVAKHRAAIDADPFRRCYSSFTRGKRFSS